jgi:hypothetical protein
MRFGPKKREKAKTNSGSLSVEQAGKKRRKKGCEKAFWKNDIINTSKTRARERKKVRTDEENYTLSIFPFPLFSAANLK